MKIEEAYDILGLKSDSSEADRHETFRRLQGKLEEKLGKAPTPGLKEKYRLSLLKLEEAIEVVELSADGGDLPLLRPDYDEGEGSGSGTRTGSELSIEASAESSPARGSSSSKSQSGKKPSESSSGGQRKEIFVAALVVILLMAAGAGWWFGYESPRRVESARLVEKALHWEEMGKLDQAIKIFEQALLVKSSSKDAQDGLERVQGELERIESNQLRDQERQAADQTRKVDRLLVAARMNLSQEKWVDALAGFQKVSRIDPNNVESSEAVIRLEKLLENARGSVVVKTEPGGATVRLGGRGEDITPANYEDLKLGSYTVEVEKTGYDLVKKDVLVRKDQTTVLGPLRLNRSEGAVVIQSEPEGMSYRVVRVRSDVSSDKDFESRSGSTPAVEADLTTGVYQVVIARSGWPDYRRNVKVVRDKKENVTTRFSQGTIVIESDPSGAEVKSGNGQLLGKTPYRSAAPTGTHTFVLSLSNYEPQKLSINVKADEQARSEVSHWVEKKKEVVATSHLKSQIGGFTTSSVYSRVYLGEYGGKTCITALQWLSGDRVSGAIFVPGSNRELRIYGSNYQHGKLRVELWEKGSLLSRGVLSKSTLGSNKISWGGTLSNGVYLQFSRVLRRSSSSFHSNYSGSMGSSDISVSIDWRADRTVSGYYKSNSTGKRYTLHGDNSVEGFLYLDEMTGGKLSARILLSKERRNGAIVWSGVLYNVKGPRRDFWMKLR